MLVEVATTHEAAQMAAGLRPERDIFRRDQVVSSGGGGGGAGMQQRPKTGRKDAGGGGGPFVEGGLISGAGRA